MKGGAAVPSRSTLHLERRHAFAGQFVSALVFGMASVPFDPMPFDIVVGAELVEALP